MPATTSSQSFRPRKPPPKPRPRNLLFDAVAEVTRVEAAEIREEAGFFDLGMDSLMAVELRNAVGSAVERPLLEVVMAQAQNNQSRAAQWLGLNRNTLRKKLVEHQLIERP